MKSAIPMSIGVARMRVSPFLASAAGHHLGDWSRRQSDSRRGSFARVHGTLLPLSDPGLVPLLGHFVSFLGVRWAPINISVNNHFVNQKPAE